MLTFADTCAINNREMERSPVLTEPPGFGLKAVVDDLNSRPTDPRMMDDRAKLLELVQAWQKSGPNLFKMKMPAGCTMNLLDMVGNCRVYAVPTRGPRLFSAINYSPPSWTAWDRAAAQFLRLISDPHCDRFGGPCAHPHCGKYFIRAGAKPKRYCSSECASDAGAREATKRTREEAHADKIKRAQEAIDRWNPRRSKIWQEFVIKNCPDTSKKFLTRAVNNEELRPPSQGSRNAES